MVTRIGKARRKTRAKFKKSAKEKGRLSLTKYLQSFEIGERVVLKMEPAVQKGIYFPRFHGKAGVVKGKQGRCYLISIKDLKKEKTVLVHPVHLKRIK